MGQRITVYLSEEALENLADIQAYLSRLTGTKVSRSAAVNGLLIRGVGLFMDREAQVQGAIMSHLPGVERSEATLDAMVERLGEEWVRGPLMKKALAIARGQQLRPFDPDLHDRDKDHGDTDEEVTG